jgi:hypothetical protein
MNDSEELRAIEELKAMTFEELQKVTSSVVRWQCKIEGCTHFTRLLDFGLENEYYKRKGVFDIDTHELTYWIKTNERFFVCHKHFKEYKIKGFDNMPLKRSKNGGIIWGFDDTGKEIIIY